MELKFTVAIRIQKPVAEVFNAVYDPKKLSGYFTNGGASAPLDEGTTVEWAFEDTPRQKVGPFPVKVKKLVRSELITFDWQGAKDHDTQVEIKFESAGPNDTIVRISESGWTDDELERSYQNCQGWSQMLSALKAYVEYGIDLRRGAYEGLHKAKDLKSSETSA